MFRLTGIIFVFLCYWLLLIVNLRKILQIFALPFCDVFKINKTVMIVTIYSFAVCIVY